MATDDEWTDDEWTDDDEVWTDDEPNDPDFERLLESVERGDVAEVRQLLDAGVDVNSKSNFGRTVLFDGDLAVVQPLVERGADVHAKDKAGNTALYDAAVVDRLGVVELLLEKGVDVNEKCYRGMTALYVAAQNGHLGLVKLLLEKGADVNAEDIDGLTALHKTATYGRSGIMELLLRQERIEVKSTDNDGWTPLHWGAARGGRLHFFFREGADHRAVVELLVTHGGDVTAEDDEGWTPIHRAALPGLGEDGDVVEPDIGIINYLLRETGAIVPLAQNVVEAHYKRERAPVAHRTRGAKRRQSSS